MRPLRIAIAALACLSIANLGAKDIRIPANKDTDVAKVPKIEGLGPGGRPNYGGGDAVGAGGRMQQDPNDIRFMTCTDGRAKNAGKLRKRLDGFPPNPDGCWYACEDSRAINSGKIDQDYFPCLFTCTDPSAINYNVGPFETPVTCVYPPPATSPPTPPPPPVQPPPAVDHCGLPIPNQYSSCGQLSGGYNCNGKIYVCP